MVDHQTGNGNILRRLGGHRIASYSPLNLNLYCWEEHASFFILELLHIMKTFT